MTSIRSSRAGGMVPRVLAVVMNMTFDRSNGKFEVMVAEGSGFVRGRALPACAEARVAAEIRCEFIDLIEHEERIGRPGPLHGLEDAPGQGADIRAAVAADLSLVAHATQRHAHELAPKRLGNGRPSEVLPVPGGPTKHRIGWRSFLGLSERTAIYSRMRSLAFFRP